MNRVFLNFLGLIGLLLLLTLEGCGSLGPASVRATRLDYNQALQRTGGEQLLVNLVRLRYNETPYFLDVTSVASQLSVTASASLSPTFTDGLSTTTTALAGTSYADAPVVTYSPLQGNQFVTRVLSPLSVDELIFLSRAGWNISQVLNLCVQQMNNLPNAPRASGPTPPTPPVFEDFRNLTAKLLDLQHSGALQLGYAEENGKSRPALLVHNMAAKSEQVVALRNYLKLNDNTLNYWLEDDIVGTDNGTIDLTTRSLLGIFFYLSQAVTIPETEIRQGLVTQTLDASGAIYDWKKMTGGILEVKVADQRPEYAAVAVPYRGHWFYIDDRDVASKSTFAFLSLLFSLKAGSSNATAPALTLPLGR